MEPSQTPNVPPSPMPPTPSPEPTLPLLPAVASRPSKVKLLVIVGIVLVLLVAGGIAIILHRSKGATPPAPITKPTSNSSSLETSALKRNAQDTKVKNAAFALLGAIAEYSANHNGSLPQDTATLQSTITGVSYANMMQDFTIVYKPAYDPSDTPKAEQLYFYSGYACEGGRPVKGSSRDATVAFVDSKGLTCAAY